MRLPGVPKTKSFIVSLPASSTASTRGSLAETSSGTTSTIDCPHSVRREPCGSSRPSGRPSGLPGTAEPARSCLARSDRQRARRGVGDQADREPYFRHMLLLQRQTIDEVGRGDVILARSIFHLRDHRLARRRYNRKQRSRDRIAVGQDASTTQRTDEADGAVG